MEKLVMSTVGRHLDEELESEKTGTNLFIANLPLPRKRIITITGETGAGVTTVANQLADTLEYRIFSAGGNIQVTGTRVRDYLG